MDDALSQEELNSLRKLAFSADRFEPFAAAVIPQRLLRRLVATGVAESGHSCRPAVAPVGYRLTADGWRIAAANWKRPWSSAAAKAARGR